MLAQTAKLYRFSFGGLPAPRNRVPRILSRTTARTLLADYPYLELEDLNQALRYAAATVDDESEIGMATGVAASWSATLKPSSVDPNSSLQFPVRFPTNSRRRRGTRQTLAFTRASCKIQLNRRDRTEVQNYVLKSSIGG